MNRRMNSRGFTLIEVMLVAGILVLLAAGGVVAYTKYQAKANHDIAQAMVSDTARAVELYQITVVSLPTTEEGLNALITPPADEKLAEKWKTVGPFLKDGKIPADPWDNPLKYELMQTSADAVLTGPAFHVWSMGPDKTDNTADDIRNWTDTTTSGG